MIWQILMLISLGITVLGETYILKFENIKYLHGGHFFIDLLIMVGLPVVTLFFGYMSHMEKMAAKKSLIDSIEKGYSKDGSASDEEHLQKLKYLIGCNAPLVEQLKSSMEQIERFEKKYSMALKLSEDSSFSKKNALEKTLKDARDIFYAGIVELETICDIFDENEFRGFVKGDIKFKDEENEKKKRDFFSKLMLEASNVVDKNEELILKVDEVTRVVSDSINDTAWDANSLIAIDELENLVLSCERATDESKLVNKEVAEQWKNMYL